MLDQSIHELLPTLAVFSIGGMRYDGITSILRHIFLPGLIRGFAPPHWPVDVFKLNMLCYQYWTSTWYTCTGKGFLADASRRSFLSAKHHFHNQRSYLHSRAVYPQEVPPSLLVIEIITRLYALDDTCCITYNPGLNNHTLAGYICDGWIPAVP